MSDAHVLFDLAEEFLDQLRSPRDTRAPGLAEFERCLLHLIGATTSVVHERSISRATQWPDHGLTARASDDLRALATARFPEFGFYHDVVPVTTDISASDVEPSVADAIDDVVDIAGHLADFVELWTRGAEDDALAMLRAPIKMNRRTESVEHRSPQGGRSRRLPMPSMETDAAVGDARRSNAGSF